jgi:hypothetical protein
MAYEVERAPGRYAKSRERDELRGALVFGVLIGIAMLASLALLIAGVAGLASSVGLIAVAFIANEFATARLDAGIRWGKGGNAEAKIGRTLEALRAEGYVVMHDLDKVGGGNIDHLVSGPTGCFVIETKFRRYEERDLVIVKRRSQRLARELETSWVQPVISFATRRYGPRVVRRVAVVGVDGLLDYIRAQSNPVVPFERLAGFADRQ